MRSTLHVLIAVIAMIPAAASAIVDVHDQYYANLESDAFSVFGFSVEGATGTKETREIGFENHSVLRRDHVTWLFVGSLNLAETNDVESEDNAFAHMRYVRSLGGRHGVDVLAQYSHDEFELLDRRVVWGGGYRYEWRRGPGDARGLAGIGAIFETERYVDRTARQELWRGNLYMTLAQPLAFLRDTRLTVSAYAQPALEDPADIRGIGVVTLSTKLNEQLSLEIGLDYSYDSDPEPGIESTNLEYSSGLTWTFK